MAWQDIAFNLLIIVISIVFGGGGIGAVIFLILRHQKYKEYKCIIWGRDAFHQITEEYDDAGIFVDKSTNNKRLYLKKSRVGLSPDNIPYIQSGKRKIVYLLRTGLKNFRYVKPSFNFDNFGFTVGEEDVNWGINAYQKAKKAFEKDWLAKYLPYIMIAVAGMIVLVLVIFVLKKFDVLVEVAETLESTAKIISRNAVTNQTIVVT